MSCSKPGEPMIGGFATWRNVPITFTNVDTGHDTVQASTYLRVTPNTERSVAAESIEIGLYAEKTGKTPTRTAALDGADDQLGAPRPSRPG